MSSPATIPIGPADTPLSDSAINAMASLLLSYAVGEPGEGAVDVGGDQRRSARGEQPAARRRNRRRTELSQV